MPNIDYFLNATPQQAQDILQQALSQQGFAVETMPTGVWAATRGSKAATFWFGAMAGKKRQSLRFTASFFQDGEQFVVRLTRESGGGAMAGAIGVARSNAAFSEVDKEIGQAFQNAGILANVVSA